MHEAENPLLRLIGPADTPGPVRLFTATLRRADGEGTLEVLHVCRVACAGEVVARLAARVGLPLARLASVREGVDPGDPIVLALLGAGTAHSLKRDGDLPGHALAGGGDLNVQQWRG